MKNTFLITTLLASVAFVSNAVAGGSCGDNCTWDLTDGVLTISGTGDMDDFRDYDNNVPAAPWKDQMDSITSVQVSNGITSIGDSAFYGARSLTSINIPDSVTSIGNSAFNGARSLTSINIPAGVTSIGDGAFMSASSLTSITIPAGVTSIEKFAFYGASSLTSINIPDSVTSIGEAAFDGARSLTSINIPDSVTSIGNGAFNDARSLTSITIPDTAALGINLFRRTNLNNGTLHCAGVLAQCQANMRNAGYADGTYNMVQAPYSKKQADGSRVYYDANGKLTGFTGKRIYTVEEATKVSGERNTFKIRYK